MISSVRYTFGPDKLGEAEIHAALEALQRQKFTMGDTVRQFESALAEWIGVRHAVMVNSGSSANLLLVDSLIRRSKSEIPLLHFRDEVLVPALSWPTTVWPLVQLGLTPVLVDVDPDTLALDLASAERALGPRTRCLFLIHVLGQACVMDPYIEFCRRKKLLLIEDCCESFGAFDAGRHVGSFGVGGTLSHYFSHHLTTIEGGTIITNDDALADDLRSMRAHGWIRDRVDREEIAMESPELDWRFLFLMPGYNVRPMEIQAAIGLVQLAGMDERLRAYDALAARVCEWLSQFAPWMRMVGGDRLKPQPASRRERRHSWMSIALMVDDDAPLSFVDVKRHFESNGVDTRPIIAGNLLRHPAAQLVPMRAPVDLPVADRIFERGLMIGCHPDRSAANLAVLHSALSALPR